MTAQQDPAQFKYFKGASPMLTAHWNSHGQHL